MSYDLHMLRVPLGEEASAVFERRQERQAKDLNPGPELAELEYEKRRLAKALMQIAPLTAAPFDYAGLAARQHVDEQEIRRRYRHLEMNAEGDSGIQITLWDDAADVTFPHWHSGEQAEDVLRQVWEFAEALEKWGAFVTFDPQLERTLDLQYDFGDVLEAYRKGPRSAHDHTASTPTGRIGWRAS
jgi:hypothetical protein